MTWVRYIVQYNNRLYMVEVDDDESRGVSVMLVDGSVWLWYWLKRGGEEYFTAEIRIGDVYNTDPLTFDDDGSYRVDVFLDMVVRLLEDGIIIHEIEGED